MRSTATNADGLCKAGDQSRRRRMQPTDFKPLLVILIPNPKEPVRLLIPRIADRPLAGQALEVVNDS
jgi:hypothetical protein